jgi:hypothetical protein
VIIPSPNSSAAPATPSSTSTLRPPWSTFDRPCTRATSAKIPPSPSLFARITNVTYLMLITTISDQNASESRP